MTADERDKLKAWAETAPIPLSDEQVQTAKVWAADDRLWNTQEFVEQNLRTFARLMLKPIREAVLALLAEVARLERDSERLAAIDAIARSERIEEAIQTAHLTDVQRVLRLTEAITSLRLELQIRKSEPKMVQAACEAAVKNLERAEAAEQRIAALEQENAARERRALELIAAERERVNGIFLKWQARACHGFDPEETDEQAAYWRGVRAVVDEAQAPQP